MAKFPEPPTHLAVVAQVVKVPAGSRIFRVYAAAGRHPASWNTFRSFGPTQSRFDHHDPPPRPQAKAILYGADDPTTCLAEYFQATRVVDRNANQPWLVGFDLQRDVQLLDLTGTWPTQAGASMAINSGPRPRARRWSRVIHASYPAVEGLLYASSMHANRRCFALYERAQAALPGAPVFHRALSDPALLPRLDAAALRIGYDLV